MARSATMLLPLLWIKGLPEPERAAINASTAPRRSLLAALTTASAARASSCNSAASSSDPTTGSIPRAATASAFALLRTRPRTVWLSAIRADATAPPIKPFAPVMKICILASPRFGRDESYGAPRGALDFSGMWRMRLRSVIGVLTIENAFEGAKVPFRRCRSVVETGAADILFRLHYDGLRQLLQTLTGPHSVKLYLRCALDVIEPVVCLGNRLTYRGNAVVGHEQHRFIAEDLGKALAFLGIKGWASVIVVIRNHFHHADFRLADLFDAGIFETGKRTSKRHMRVEHDFGVQQRLMNWRVNAIAGPLDVAGPTLNLTIVDTHLHERRGLNLRPVHAKGDLVVAVRFARDHLGQVIDDTLV